MKREEPFPDQAETIGAMIAALDTITTAHTAALEKIADQQEADDA